MIPVLVQHSKAAFLRQDVLLAVPVGDEVAHLAVHVATKELNPQYCLILINLLYQLAIVIAFSLRHIVASILHELLVFAHWKDID